MFKKQVKCAECGFLGTLVLGLDDVVRWQEIHPEQRSDLLEIYKDAPLHIGCMRGQDHLIAGAPQPGKPINREKLLRNSYEPRKCVYFYHYNPGYTPNQHLELLRERTQRRFLIIVTILSAAVGAGIATLVNLVWSK